jgi:hypothetical protein
MEKNKSSLLNVRRWKYRFFYMLPGVWKSITFVARTHSAAVILSVFEDEDVCGALLELHSLGEGGGGSLSVTLLFRAIKSTSEMLISFWYWNCNSFEWHVARLMQRLASAKAVRVRIPVGGADWDPPSLSYNGYRLSFSVVNHSPQPYRRG